MWNWLKSAAQKGLEAGAEYLANRAFILEVLQQMQSADGDAAGTFIAKAQTFDEQHWTSFIGTLNGMLEATQNDLKRALAEIDSLGETPERTASLQQLYTHFSGLQAISQLIQQLAGVTPQPDIDNSGSTTTTTPEIDVEDEIEALKAEIKQQAQSSPDNILTTFEYCARLQLSRHDAGLLSADDIDKWDKINQVILDAEKIPDTRRREARLRRLRIEYINAVLGEEVVSPQPQSFEDQVEAQVDALTALSAFGMSADALLADMIQQLLTKEATAQTLHPARREQLELLLARAQGLHKLKNKERHEAVLWELCEEFLKLVNAGSEQAQPTAPTPVQHNESDGQLAKVQAFKVELETALASGKMTPTRASMYRSLLADLENVIQLPRDTAQQQIIFRTRMRELLDRQLESLRESNTAPPAGSRAARLHDYAGQLQSFVLQEATRPNLKPGEHDAIQSLGSRIVRLFEAIEKLPDDAAAYALEREEMRRLVADLRQYQRRTHLLLAQPVWPTPLVNVEASAVFYSGGANLRKTLETVCQRQGLSLLTQKNIGKTPAEDRWNQLRACTVAVFDLTEYGRYEKHQDIERAARAFAVCYELGIAFSLGVAVVIAGRADQEMPFDIDIEPVRLPGDETDADVLTEALDAAFYGSQRVNAGNSVRETVNYLRHTYGSADQAELGTAIQHLDDTAAQDPIMAAPLIQHAISLVEGKTPHMLYPAYPSAYPAPDKPLCFLITAFRKHLVDTMNAVKDACKLADIEFVRGDQALEPDIIFSIWDNICRSTHIIVDTTDFNPNVAIELGMAHTLGRRILVISQPGTMGKFPPTLSKVRIHYYSFTGEPGTEDLYEKLGQFLR